MFECMSALLQISSVKHLELVVLKQICYNSCYNRHSFICGMLPSGVQTKFTIIDNCNVWMYTCSSAVTFAQWLSLHSV
ncbi:hypothetical protein JOB18_022458 [Solea senegalensis]|uniref:Uncharacterized protein n=1 Tax=Solea senegalensis TaxID=28829 RepID=A0AAV6S3U8_SOLSE|nr:hypothetical protein JOB18_022458 [Solea senegalensis]